MDTGAVIASALLVAGAIGLAIAFVRNERAQVARERAPAAPRVLRLSTVDIGSMRYFDVRSFPLDVLRGRLATDAAVNAERAGRERPAAYVWVLPAGYERFLLELEASALAIVLSRFQDPAAGSAARTFVYVDGWSPPKGSLPERLGRDLGVELLLELPVLIDPSHPGRDVRAMLDAAARG